MAREVEELYGGERAPLSDVTAAAYGRESAGTERQDNDGSAAAR